MKLNADANGHDLSFAELLSGVRQGAFRSALSLFTLDTQLLLLLRKFSLRWALLECWQHSPNSLSRLVGGVVVLFSPANTER